MFDVQSLIILLGSLDILDVGKLKVYIQLKLLIFNVLLPLKTFVATFIILLPLKNGCNTDPGQSIFVTYKEVCC